MVYLIVNQTNSSFKIGFSESVESCYDRLLSLQTANCCELELIGIIRGEQSDEAHLHFEYKEFHKRGEWFHLNYRTQKLLMFHFGSGLEWYFSRTKPFIFLQNMYESRQPIDIIRIIENENKQKNGRGQIKK